MAQGATRFHRVGDILACFIAQGCELRTAEATVTDPEGDVFNLRYLLRVSTGAHVALVDLTDDDRVSEAELRQWERRLGLTVPRT